MRSLVRVFQSNKVASEPMRPRQRAIRLVTLMLALTGVACHDRPLTPQEALGPITVPEAIPANPYGPPPALSEGNAPRQALVTTPLRAPLSEATTVDDPSAPRMDTSSAEAFAASMQRIRASLSPDDQKQLQGSMMLFAIRMQQRMATMGQTYTDSAPPQFTDKQLLDIGFGDLNGMTGAQVIEVARRYAESLPPEAKQAIARAAAGQMPPAAGQGL